MNPESISCAADSLKERYENVMARVARAAERSGRRAGDIVVVAVTKNANPEHICELIEAGHADFAENRVQSLIRRTAMVDEFLSRHRTMTPSHPVTLPSKLRWHMIGHLQRNKVRKAVELTALIQSVDSLRVAEEIQECAGKRDEIVEVLLQVNASFEKSKTGVALPAARHMAEQIDSLVNLRLRGLMTMGPLTDDVEAIRTTFERTVDCAAEITKAGIGGKSFNILSMGMTNDFEIAIEYGANLVRIGTAIFGPRDESADDESGLTDDEH